MIKNIDELFKSQGMPAESMANAESIRKMTAELAKRIVAFTPINNYQTLAIRELEKACMFAMKAISHDKVIK